MNDTTLLNKIRTSPKPLTFAIDGPCGGGKSTLARELATGIDCTVVSADDFFLPGGEINLDVERLEREVLLSSGETLTYHKYNCATGQMTPITTDRKPVTIIEGSYSAILKPIDFFVFLDVDRQEQLQRLQQRNPDKYNRFATEWIPKENAYFDKYAIREKAKQKPNIYTKSNFVCLQG